MLDKNSLDIAGSVMDEQADKDLNELATEPRLDLGQLENDSVSSLSPAPNQQNDDGEDIEEGEGALDLSSLSLPDEAPDTAEDEAEREKTDAEALYHDTVSLMKTGKTDLSTGVKLLLQAAQGGYAPAWLHLGQIYSNKKYALYNPALAFDCYCGAADLGLADGHYNKGLCYSTGFGCEKDELFAIQSFARGAEVFDPNCICAMAMCYEFGQGCDVNYEYAFNLYEKGMELGHAGCANNLGGCYLYGHGVEQDKARAVEIFKKACELGSTNAKCRLGLCYLSGDGCEQNESAAFECFKSAAEQNNSIALFNLASCYDTGVGTEQNFRLAFKYYNKAASQGHAAAQYMAGKMSMDGRGTKRDAATAYRMFSSAARCGYAPAEYELANCFFEGAGAVRNRANAYSHYLASFEAQGENAADAAYRLGLCHLKGLGTQQNKSAAVEWFTRGTDLGSPNATYMLAECLHYGVGTEVDDDRAFALYSEAAQTALTDPMSVKSYASLFLSIAQCYERGTGAHKDAAKAIAAYKQAGELGDYEALYRTGRAILAGVGMRSEYPAARTHFLRAARHAYMPAMLMMGKFSEQGLGVPKSLDDAKSWYYKAVTANNEPQMSIYDFPERFYEGMTLYREAKNEAQYRYGMMIARSGEPDDRLRAFEYISLSAANGYTPAKIEITKIHISGGDLKAYYESPFSREDATFDGGHNSPSAKDLAIAMYKLGDAFFEGNGLLKKNEAASASCYRSAAELGMIDACYSYGWCLRHGVGTEENDAEAVKWLKLAADKGNAGAAYSYGLCCEEGAGTGIKNKREAMYYYRIAAASGHAKAAERYVLLSSRAE
ncbi:MAG: sel1 repeat family protein [Clostridia bacterium]|nr:sel1 repeat family protein [Clostridia bacterium]